jgi:hypothetical protein
MLELEIFQIEIHNEYIGRRTKDRTMKQRMKESDFPSCQKSQKGQIESMQKILGESKIQTRTQ